MIDTMKTDTAHADEATYRLRLRIERIQSRLMVMAYALGDVADPEHQTLLDDSIAMLLEMRADLDAVRKAVRA